MSKQTNMVRYLLENPQNKGIGERLICNFSNFGHLPYPRQQAASMWVLW